jgi:peptide chain release factor 1
MAFVASKEMLSRLEESRRRFNSLTDQMSNPMIIANRSEFMKISRERSHLESVVTLFNEFDQNYQNYLSSREMMVSEKDPEMHEMAVLEVAELEPLLEKQAEELQLLMLPKDPNDEKNVIIEIRAGVGGDEAGIFAGDLFDMYKRYSETKGYRVEVMSLAENSSGGWKEVIALIEGSGAFSTLKYESGVHRVQRVPKTETQGRIHTSTATVVVMPEAEEVDLEINPNELRIDVFRSGGSGGQSVNTTDSAVRITHVPTGEVVICQDEKSQLKNKNKAMKVLRSRLLEKAQEEAKSVQDAARRSLVGGGFRNERIRTYNYPQSRITDHRINLTTHNLTDVVGGKLDAFVAALHNYYQTLALKGEAPAPLAQASDD